MDEDYRKGRTSSDVRFLEKKGDGLIRLTQEGVEFAGYNRKERERMMAEKLYAYESTGTPEEFRRLKSQQS